MQHRKQVVLHLLTVVALILSAGAVLPASAASGVSSSTGNPVTVTDAPQTPVTKLPKSNYDPNKLVRVIIQLADAPLASYKGELAGLKATSPAVTGAAKLDVNSAESQSYAAYLMAKQLAFRAQLVLAVPGAQIEHQYYTVLNGMAAKVRMGDLNSIRALPGVKAATVEREYKLDMDASLALIGLGSPDGGVGGSSWVDSGLWAAAGGHANAGAGVKIADIDSGITMGNPCFSGTGYTYPAGFPKGEAAYTNGKIIAARAYFRPSDPPVYPATPADDPGGAAEGGHGDHTAGTMVCNYGTTTTFLGTKISGVAPKAQLMVYRVFYYSVSGSHSAFDPELIMAIEDAVADGADVVNNSWGGTAVTTIADDPLVNAYSAAVDAGMVVVFSNGNSGPTASTVGSPAIGPKFISAGASTTDRIFAKVLNVTGPSNPPTTTVPVTLTNVAAVPGDGPAITTTLAANFTYVSSNSLGCSAFAAGTFTGQIALIKRGTCTFATKVGNAEAAGAIGVVIANNAGGPPTAMSGLGGVVNIPAVMVTQNDGNNLISWYNANPVTAQLEVLATLGRFTNSTYQDLLASFSSRGPNVDMSIKPDITAPGVNILSSVSYDLADPTVVSNDGFDLYQGTSMAAPHVTGATALLKQLHPTWTPAQIKSALMSTAAQPASLGSNPQNVGAGRLNLTAPNDPGLTFDQPSLSFGILYTAQVATQTVTALNMTASPGTYTVTAVASAGTFTPTVPLTIAVTANGTAMFNVVAAPSATGDAYGNIYLTDGTVTHTLHIPYWARTITNLGPANVLLIDDSNNTLFGGVTCIDRVGVYTQTLTNLGLTYVIYTVPAYPSPIDFNLTRKYSKAIYIAGDSGCGGSLNLNTSTMASYLANGGKLLVSGQDVPAIDGAFGFTLNTPLYFGATFVQDTLYPNTTPVPTMYGDSTYSAYLMGQNYDINPLNGNGAGNQVDVDEIAATFETDLNALPILYSAPVTTSVKSPAQLGTRISSEPTIERVKGNPADPWTPLGYRTEYLSFGLEGVNNNTGFNTREQLLDRLLTWLDDQVTVSFDAASYHVVGPSYEVSVSATASTSITTTTTGFANSILFYRWDFGDGTPIQVTSIPSASHLYASNGFYQPYVEATDAYGHVMVGQPVMIQVGTYIYLPLILK